MSRLLSSLYKKEQREGFALLSPRAKRSRRPFFKEQWERFASRLSSQKSNSLFSKSKSLFCSFADKKCSKNHRANSPLCWICEYLFSFRPLFNKKLWVAGWRHRAISANRRAAGWRLLSLVTGFQNFTKFLSNYFFWESRNSNPSKKRRNDFFIILICSHKNKVILFGVFIRAVPDSLKSQHNFAKSLWSLQNPFSLSKRKPDKIELFCKKNWIIKSNCTVHTVKVSIKI